MTVGAAWKGVYPVVGRDDMNAQARILKAHPLLSLLPRAAFNNLIAHASTSEFPKGSMIIREGDPSEGLYLLLSGRCESFTTLQSGREKLLGILGPGDTFGDRDLLFQSRYQNSVRVITKCVVLRVDGEELKRLLEEKVRTNGYHESNTETFLVKREACEHVSPPHFGRIVTFAALSRGIPDHLIVENLAQNLRDITGEPVLVVRLVTAEGVLSLKDWTQIQMALSSGFYFAKHLPRTDGGFNRLSLRTTGEPQERAAIAPLLSQLGRHFRYVLLHVDDEIPVLPLLECIIQSDVAYLALEQTSHDLSRFDMLTTEVKAQSKADCVDIRPIVYVAEGMRSREFHQKIKTLGAPSDNHHGPLPNGFARLVHYLDEGSGAFNADLRRLAREIARCRVGLALSFGAARGLAHVGVIQVLEENGIEVDIVSGCSMGAYVGSLWSFGCDGDYLEKLAREMESRWAFWHLLDIAFPPRRGFIYGKVGRNHLKRTLGDAHFCDMVRPLRIVATHLESLERVVFSAGEVAEAVHASSSIPGICVPLTLNGETYIDGGVVDPLPVDVLQEMGIEKIIAVNVNAPVEQRRCWAQKQREEFERNLLQRKTWMRFLRRQVNYFERGNILDIIMQGFLGAQIRSAEEAAHMADIVIRPIDCDSHAHEFSNPGKYIALGRKAAEENLQQLKALVTERIATPNEKHHAPPGKVAVAA